VSDVRDFLKWTTGARNISYLDLVDGNEKIQYSFLGRVTNAFQQKMDARTVGLILEFTSNSPWAYSPKQTTINNELWMGESLRQINNKSDDLYSYIYPNITFQNTIGDNLIIKNLTTGDITQVNNLKTNERVTLDSNMIISSESWAQIASVNETTIGTYYIADENVLEGYTEVTLPEDYMADTKYYQLLSTNRTFGNDFNFVFPKLAAGINDLVITGAGILTLEYVYPIKIGDCTIDIDVSGSSLNCGGTTGSNGGGGTVIVEELSWENITNKPTTVDGYGLTDVYTKKEIDIKMNNVSTGFSINAQELQAMLDEVLV
jgi:hypothetical protein